MAEETNAQATRKKRCFVVMGFGVKTDYATGRKLDLNKSYKYLIKPVVERKGLECVRADEILHSGVIDVPMYRELMEADVVIADLSTANLNATYELGIRHALRPYTTIVISESQLPYPFDLNHISITSYKMFEQGIDIEEAERFTKVLGDRLDAVLAKQETDSPVYTYLRGLTPPRKELEKALEAAARPAGSNPEPAAAVPGAEAAVPGAEAEQKTLLMLVEMGEQAIQRDDFVLAKSLFTRALDVCTSAQTGPEEVQPRDAYLIQRLALATYKVKQSDDVSKVNALNEALRVLEPLRPEDSNDPETVGLAGAIEKRHFDLKQGDEHLARSIWYYSRGYYLRNDWYNGINLAYLMNVRTDTALDPTDADKIADLVYANRIRREVLLLCDQTLKGIRGRNQQADAKPGAKPDTLALRKAQRDSDWEQSFWVQATKAEAYFGLGELKSYEATKAEAYALQPAPAGWMKATFEAQVDRLRALLEKHGRLLQPPWPGGAV